MPVFNTKNGPKTVAQMKQELLNAGWNPIPGFENNQGTIANAYQQTTGGPVTPTASQPGGDPQGLGYPGSSTILQQQNGGLGDALQKLLEAIASGNAQAIQEQIRQFDLNYGLDVRKLDEAVRQYNQGFTITEAGLTGTYQGQPTLAAQQQQANISGQYTDYNGFAQRDPQAKALAAINPSLLDPRYQQELLKTRGYVFYAGENASSPTLAAQTAQSQTALGYLNLIGNLRGPADYGQYLRVLGSTPGGLRDLVSGAMGQYTPATGATTGAAPTPAALGSVQSDVTGAGGATNFADYTAAAQNLPRPNQISPAAWNAYTDSQKQLLLGMYESTGYRPQDVLDLYKQSLPKYSYSGTGAIKL